MGENWTTCWMSSSLREIPIPMASRSMKASSPPSPLPQIDKKKVKKGKSTGTILYSGKGERKTAIIPISPNSLTLQAKNNKEGKKGISTGTILLSPRSLTLQAENNKEGKKG